MANLSFPAGFKFGVASAAYQSEGAAMSEGKGPSQWDWAGRQPGSRPFPFASRISTYIFVGVVEDQTNGTWKEH